MIINLCDMFGYIYLFFPIYMLVNNIFHLFHHFLKMFPRKFVKFNFFKLTLGALGLGIISLLFLNLWKEDEAQLRVEGLSAPAPVPKVLCYILLEERKWKVGKLIKATWGSHCDKIIFFGNYINGQLPVTRINCTEGYEFLWDKSKAALQYLNIHFGSEFNWFFKADDDTFVIVENLKEFIGQLGELSEGPLSFGFKMRHKKMTQGYMSGGAGYAFNAIALHKVVSVLEKNKERNYYVSDSLDEEAPLGCRSADPRGVEDLELGRCLKAVGVADVKTEDEKGRLRFLPLSLNSLMNGQVDSAHWIWHQAWTPFKTGAGCCSDTLISIHEVTPQQMRILYFIIYQLKRQN